MGLQGLDVASTQDSCEGVCESGSGATDGSNSCHVRALGGRTSERDSIGNNNAVRELISCTQSEAKLQFVELLRVVSCRVSGQRR